MLPEMQRLLYVLVFGVLITTGLAHGLIPDRWSNLPDPQVETGAFARVPMVIDEWDGRSMETEENLLAQEQVGHGVVLRYVNRVNGSAVTVFLSGGRPGPLVAAHAPD